VRNFKGHQLSLQFLKTKHSDGLPRTVFTSLSTVFCWYSYCSFRIKHWSVF